MVAKSGPAPLRHSVSTLTPTVKTVNGALAGASDTGKLQADMP
jgi:hypothetical protein